MYKIEKKITNISPYNIFFKDDAILVLDKKNKNISCITLNDFHIKWKIENQKYGFIILNNKIVCNNIIIYNVEGKLEYKHQGIEEFYNIEIFDIKNNFVLYKTVNEDEEKILYHIFDIDAKIFIKINIGCPTPVLFISKSKLLCKTRNLLSVYEYDTEKILWQKDLSEITSYTDWDGKHQGNVKNVYLYENKLIVVSGNSVLAMNIETADILWQIKYDDFQPFTLHINNHFAYLSKGVFYSVIDLEKGEKVLETMLIRPFDHDPEYEKANLAMVGSDMTFYDNYLYFSDKHKGEYYLAKLNPHTAKIEEYQFLEEVKSNLAPPKFYDNKMFLLDSNNNLFIYERE